MLSFLVSFAILGGVGATAVATHKHHPTNILPLPTVDDPIVGGTKGHPFSAFAGNITSLGYVEEEYFLTGYGNRYNVIGNLTQDGLWKLSYNSTAPYKTRVLVRRPIDRKNFNGDVVIEWINVSAGFDITSADTPGIYKNGYIWAGISAQTVGVNGQSPNPQGLVQWDPARYGTLNIPDDAISYGIATAAGRIFRTGKISSGWIPEKVILTGGSQSGTRVLGYVNGVQNLNATFDSVIPVICAGFAADYSFIPAHPNVTNINAHSRAIPTIVRKDINAPIFMLNSETEALAYAEAGNRQDPSSTFREWEITGGSHANLGAEIFLEGQRKLD
ncbi:hypothetical protein TrVGV298_003409 [Trichoderma virens]|nr:hypothetical protein TrVGV298_003409 [Trichoderma virens]